LIPLLADMAPELIAITRGAMAAHDAAHLAIIMIDGWFGPKWIGFQGKVLGSNGAHSSRHAESPHLYTLPPFVPARVVAEQRFGRLTDGSWKELQDRARLHIAQPSDHNRTRTLASLVDPRTLLIWHGSTRDRASMMAYWVTADRVDSWHLTAERTSEPIRLIGTRIRPDELDRLKQLGVATIQQSQVVQRSE
jgi:hypothetical protein